MNPSSLITEGKLISVFTSSVSGTWSTNAGTLWLNTQATDPYTGQSVMTVYLKAANKTFGGTISRGTDTGSVSITGIYPGSTYYPYNWEDDKPGAIVNVKRDGSIIARMLGNSVQSADYNLVSNGTIAEYLEFREFWRHHYPHLRFKFIDKMLNETFLAQFTSRPKVTGRSYNYVSYEVQIRRV